MKPTVSAGFAFIAGYKPAVITTPQFKYFSYLVDNYPYIDEQDKHRSHMFFQSNELKQSFLQQSKSVPHDANHPMCAKILGLTLGFAPQSVEYFCQCLEKEQQGHACGEINQEKIGINFSGISFSTHIDIVKQEVEWLWDRYQHPIAIESPSYIRVESQLLSIPFGDTRVLDEVEQKVRWDIHKIHMIT